jgi:hypothetical protein
MTSALSQPASCTQGLVAIDTLGPAGEYRDTHQAIVPYQGH